MGEKPLIILDNLDSQLRKWNKLAELFQEEVNYNYKILVTSREDDWYNFGGDLSNIKSLNVINLSLKEKEAKEIYLILEKNNKLHESVTNWEESYRAISDRGLLIEYIYLLTHGQMLSERIDEQLKNIGNSPYGKVKCDILRKICLADICGVRLQSSKIFSSFINNITVEPTEILRSLENEYFIRMDDSELHIEGLHPVRSHHIVNNLHEYISLENTILEIVNLIEPVYKSKFYFSIPRLIKPNQNFYNNLVIEMWDSSDLSSCCSALQGVFSGSVQNYFQKNKTYFDKANENGLLLFFSMELNPFMQIPEISTNETSKIDEILKTINPENWTLLHELKNKSTKIDISKSDIYFLSKALYEYIKDKTVLVDFYDVKSFSKICYWLIRMNKQFNLSTNVSLDTLWSKYNKEEFLETLSMIMYTNWLGNNKEYTIFVKNNIKNILTYLRNCTNSISISLDDNNSIHILYPLLLSNIDNANSESVHRINIVCKMLPIYKEYNTTSLKPNITSIFIKYDDSEKHMPARNVISTFNQEFNQLWKKTIYSNYESGSISEWIDYWLKLRRLIIEISKRSYQIIINTLCEKQSKRVIQEINMLISEYQKYFIRVFNFHLSVLKQ